MRIISKFKDYYDFNNNIFANSGDYREIIYLRNPELKLVDKELLKPFTYFRDRDFYDIIIQSKWWEKNKRILSLGSNPRCSGGGCLFVAGRAYPFLYLRDVADMEELGRSSQVKFSRTYNEIDSKSTFKSQSTLNWQKKEGIEYNFFKTYFSVEEFKEDITINLKRYYSKCIDDLEKEFKQFFQFYEGKSYENLHLQMDAPVLLTLFDEKPFSYYYEKKEYVLMTNPNLSEFGFMRVMHGDTVRQEIEMFLGSVLVKDIMPPSYQSDVDKLTAHGFDKKTSFRKSKG